MKLSRDSLLLWIPVLGALIAYLLSAPPPTEWGYTQWLQFAAAVVATASAKLMRSPLKGENDAPSVNPSRFGPLVLILLLAGGASGCAAKFTPLQQVQVTHDALATAQDLEAQLCWGVATVHQGPADRSYCTTPVAQAIGLTTARHQALNGKLKIAFDLHRSITAQIAAGLQVNLTSLKTAILDILAFITQLQQTPAVAQLTAAVKAGEIR